MAKKIGRNLNTNDTAILHDVIVVGDSESVTLLPIDLNRTYIAITVLKKDTWIKFQAAAVDDDKKGIFVKKNMVYEMASGDIFTGEISAICEKGDAELYITEL